MLNLGQLVRFTTEVTTSVVLVIAQIIVLILFEIGISVFRAMPRKANSTSPMR
ncbi:hypothetical protein [Alicyclobacillus ferrooxydans]|uniref:hypothetical protein n=1 Tax=Alicyclobacillus ferrooxydans TaxID=471514 RepID=UPI000B13E125|nr:hypothetical protein [Alicyclobacillus ferrooxydans]